MYKHIVKVIFVSIAALILAPTAFALGGGGAGSVEPGGACEKAGEGMFHRANGEPFSGTANVSWNNNSDATVRFSGEATQSETGCKVTFSGGYLDSIFQKDFEALTERDLVGICLGNVEIADDNTGDCSKKVSGFMETLFLKKLRAIESASGTKAFNVNVMLTPLSQEGGI